MTEMDLVEEALVAVELLVVGKKGNTVMQQYKKTYEIVGTKEQLEQIDLMLLSTSTVKPLALAMGI